ncbi:MAG: nitronate monooxygenase [Pseudomonadota bacterium]
MLTTRFTERFALTHPIALAPMDKVAGGALAASVADAGGLGIIGGGYGDQRSIVEQLSIAGDAPVGIGLIIWSVLDKPELIEWCLSQKPKIMAFGFGDATEFIQRCKDAKVATLWQVQTLADAELAAAAGTDVIVAQGQEAGGHGQDRGLMSLLPAIRDQLGPEQIILGAGGIADGRGLAAALMLGADGVMMGTRFWAAHEANGLETAKAQIIGNGGDETIRSSIFDIARNIPWPEPYTGRCIQNAFSRRWQDDIGSLREHGEEEQRRFNDSPVDDFTIRPVIAGEAIDLINSIESAQAIIERMVTEASGILSASNQFVSS